MKFKKGVKFVAIFFLVTVFSGLVQAQNPSQTGPGSKAGSPLEIPKPPKMVTLPANINDVSRGIYQPLVNLKVHNGMFLVAEKGGGSKILANREAAREWETFSIIDLNKAPLMSGDRIQLKTYSKPFYVSVSNGSINASRSQAASAETFTIIKLRGSGPIQFGDKIALMSFQNRYVVAEGGGGKMVNANRTKADIWETFTLVRSKFQQVSVQGTWHDTHGNQYNFGQKDGKFWWRAPALMLYGEGTINQETINNKIYAEANHQLKGTVSGTLKDIQLDGFAKRIEWADGMVFQR